VDTHTHPQLLTTGPGLCAELPLHRERCCDARTGRGEDGKERVAVRALFHAAEFFETRTDDPVMVLECCGVGGVAQAGEQCGGALDVREQECQSLECSMKFFRRLHVAILGDQGQARLTAAGTGSLQ
jgi:hypothetical protein